MHKSKMRLFTLLEMNFKKHQIQRVIKLEIRKDYTMMCEVKVSLELQHKLKSAMLISNLGHACAYT